MDFKSNVDLYKNLLDEYSVTSLSYIDGFEINVKREISAILMSLCLKKKITIDDNGIKILNDDRKKYGNNNISVGKKNSFLKLLLESFGDPIIRILLIALAIKLVFFMKNFDWYETVGIVIAIFLASFISTISEYGSEKAFKKLTERIENCGK